MYFHIYYCIHYFILHPFVAHLLNLFLNFPYPLPQILPFQLHSHPHRDISLPALLSSRSNPEALRGRKGHYRSSGCIGSHSLPAARTPAHPVALPRYTPQPGCIRFPSHSICSSGHDCRMPTAFPDISSQMRSPRRMSPYTVPDCIPGSSRPGYP